MITKKGIALSMVQPAPLPGSYRHKDMPLKQIIDEILHEVDIIVGAGFDGIILQNMNDMPVKQKSSPEAIAYMTIIGYEIKKRFSNLIMGVLMNWDGVAALSVADAIGADFMRVEHLFTGVEVTSAGLLEAQCCEIAQLRKRIGSKIPVFADIYEVHGVPLGAKEIDDAAWEAVNEAFADGLFICGKTTDQSIDMVRKVRPRVPNIPLYLGGGATGHNIYELLQHFDGVSVATWIKNGDMKNPVDTEKAKLFIREVNRARDLF